MMIFFIFLGLIFSLGFMGTRPYADKFKKVIVKIHLATLFSTIILYTIFKIWGINFRGAEFDGVIPGLWYMSGMMLYGLYPKHNARRWLKIYYGFYFWLVIIICAIGIVAKDFVFAMLFFILLFSLNIDQKRIQVDDNWHVCYTSRGLLSVIVNVYLVKELNYVFEKRVNYSVTLQGYFGQINAEIVEDNIVRIWTDDDGEFTALDTLLDLNKF